jgi:hypothetical protein
MLFHEKGITQLSLGRKCSLRASIWYNKMQHHRNLSYNLQQKGHTWPYHRIQMFRNIFTYKEQYKRLSTSSSKKSKYSRWRSLKRWPISISSILTAVLYTSSNTAHLSLWPHFRRGRWYVKGAKTTVVTTWHTILPTTITVQPSLTRYRRNFVCYCHLVKLL